MEKIALYNSNGLKSEVYLVRYFKLDYTNYLVYTIFERDEKGFIKLYLIKIMDELGKKIGISILDDEEWKGMQKIIKTVIKEIKDKKITSFEDLLTNGLDKIKIGNAKFFKLDQNLTDLLGLKVENHFELEEQKTALNKQNVDSDNDKLISYSLICKDIRKKIKRLNILIDKKIIELDKYKKDFGLLDNLKFTQKLDIDLKMLSKEDNIENYNKISEIMENQEEALVNILIDLTNYTLLNIKKGL